jgi:hypothetical protein
LCVVACNLLAVVLIALAVATPAQRVSGATAPSVLLVTDSTNSTDPFGSYLGEILRAEGIMAFTTADVSTVTPSSLSSYTTVLLGPISSASGGLVNTLTTWVQGGGRLIAMHPPTSLASLFGVTSVGSTTNNGYMAITGGGLGGSFNTTPLQIHTPADNYTLNGATAVAKLYSSATSATPYPSVTLMTVGQGQVMLWAYDLAQSVVYTRQGNPTNPQITNSDGGYRDTDLYTNYVDLNNLPIPQADEQQRLLAKAILTLNPAPMPHLWYFPQNAGTILVLTGDAHGQPTSPYFTQELTSIQKYGGHITFYLSQASAPTASDVASWKQAGHSVGIHPYANPTPPTGANCGTTDGSGINASMTSYQSWFQSQFGTAPSPTVRIHQVAWQCWTDAATFEVNHGIGLDTDAYTWGSWLKKSDGTWAHGFTSGSGLPMQMMDATGHLIPVFQQSAPLVDEQLVAGIPSGQENLSGAQAAAVSQQMIDGSLTGGNYAALMTQFHVDYYGGADATAFAEGTMSYAQSKGVPIWNADEWLRFTKARAGTTFGASTWDGTTLTFTMTVPSGPDAMPLMLPASAVRGLTSVTVDGSSASLQSRTVKGSKSSIVMVSAGTHTITANYTGPVSDTTAPTVSLTAPTNGTVVSGSAFTVSASASDNVGVTSVQFLLDGAPLGSPVTTLPYSIAWNSIATANGTHTLNVQASDAAGNVGIGSDVTVTVTNPPQFSAVAASNVQSTTATISWTTDKPSTSKVDYGTTTAYGKSTTLDGTLVTSHVQGLSGLTANTTYHYRVDSTDAAGIAGSSGDFTFTTSGAGATVLVGDQTIETNPDNNPAGTAEAFPYTAGTSGNVDTLVVYIDSPNASSQVVVGLYTNSVSNNPGTLLAQGTIVSPTKAAWNNVTVPLTPVTIGTKYWIAILSTTGKGTVNFRDHATGGTTAQGSAQTNLTSLPTTWSSGGSFTNGPMSAYAEQANGTPPPPDTTPPTVSLTAPTSGATVSGNAVTVSASASDNIGVTSVQFQLDGASLGTPVTSVPYSIAWDTTAVTNGAHTLSAQAQDAAGNVGTATNVAVTVSNTAATPTPTATATNTPSATATNTPTATPSGTPASTATNTPTPTPTATATATAVSTPTSPGQFVQGAPQFTQGSSSGLAVGVDGSLSLIPAFADDFTGTTLNSTNWSTTQWSPGGAATVSSSAVSVDGVGIGTSQSFTQRSFEARALFTAGPPAFQNLGWSPDLNGSQWILFGEPGFDSAHVYARVNTGSGEQLVQMPVTLGVYHTYRIDWRASAIDFSVDGTLMTTITATLNNPMPAWLSVGPTGHPLTVDWARVLQYSPTSGTYTSAALDAGASTSWQTLSTTGTTPSGTTLGVQTRSSVDGVTWSAYQVVGAGGAITSPQGRFLQYQLAFTGSTTAAPAVSQVTVTFG